MIRDVLESRQIVIYFVAMLLAGLMASVWVMPASLVDWINPALAFMLYVTFLQVPVSQLGKALTQLRFLAVLLVANFAGVLVDYLVGIPYWGLMIGDLPTAAVQSLAFVPGDALKLVASAFIAAAVHRALPTASGTRRDPAGR